MTSKLVSLIWSILLLLAFYSLAFSSEKIKIVKILDTNLFLLEDGRQISLANLKMPSKNDTSKVQQSIAKRILIYEKQHFLNRDLEMERSPAANQQKQPIPVHLFQSFLFNKINFNKELLNKGYAFYQPIDSLYKEEYERAARQARAAHRAVWDPELFFVKKKVDFFLGINGLMGQVDADEFQEKDELNSLEAHIMIVNPAHFARGEAKIGKLRVREKGFAACEAGPARHYAVDALYNYYILNTQFNFTYVGFGVGFFALLNTKRGFCREAARGFAIPTANLRFGYLKKMFVAAEVMNNIYEVLKITINYRFNNPYSKIWIGYIDNGDKDYTEPSIKKGDFITVGGQYLFFKKFLFNFSGQIVPYSSNKFFKLGLAFKIYSN